MGTSPDRGSGGSVWRSVITTDASRHTAVGAARDLDAADDVGIVRAVLDGDRDAFRIVVERESSSVIRACYRVLADQHEAEDVAQEAFVIAYRSLASWRGEGVVIGAATDPYQPVEGRYRLTRGCLEALAAAANPFSLITRGPMIVRDVDVLQRAAPRAEVDVTFSIPTLDVEIWRRTEPGTAPPRQRLRALRTLIDAGIDAAVGIAPILPGLSDRPELLADVVRAARDAGATSVWCNVLYLQPGTREYFLAHLARDWPALLPRYLELYRTPYPSRAVTAPLREEVAALARRLGIADRRARPLEPAPPPEQLRLAM